MKEVLKDNHHIILRFDKGEEIISALADYAEQNNIKAAAFSGIGSCSTAELGYYNPFIKDYRKKPILDNLEIVSLTGNIAMVDGKPIVHAHGLFANNEFSVIGGHVFKAEILATCEIVLTKMEGQLGRENNTELNLKLLM